MNQSLPATRLTPEGTLVLPNRLTVRKCTRGPRAIPSESTANATNPFRIADFRFRDRSRRPIEDPVLDAGRRSKRRGGVEAPIPDASGADLRCRGEDSARRRCVVQFVVASFSNRSSRGRWPSTIFVRAIGSVNHSARSTSGNVCSCPLLGGHSISKRITRNGLDVQVAVDGECVDALAAMLTYLAQRL